MKPPLPEEAELFRIVTLSNLLAKHRATDKPSTRDGLRNRFGYSDEEITVAFARLKTIQDAQH